LTRLFRSCRFGRLLRRRARFLSYIGRNSREIRKESCNFA
jgi:hypothetical protein